MAKVASKRTKKADKEDWKSSKELKELEEAMDYISKTSIPKLSWRVLLGRSNEAND